MNEKSFEQIPNPIFSLDTELVAQIRTRKSEGNYGGILDSLSDFKKILLEDGYAEHELAQVPAWYVMIGGSVPCEEGTVWVERTISNARQEEIEARIREFMTPFLPAIESEETK